MDEYIRRQAALDAFGLSDKTRKYGGDHSGYDTRMLYEIQDTLEDLPTEDVAPVRHGYWIRWAMSDECSECGYDTGKYSEGTKFCPDCGAKMDAQPIGHKLPPKSSPNQLSYGYVEWSKNG